METVFEEEDKAVVLPKKALPAALEAYKFKPGHGRIPGNGRPVGVKNAQTVLLDAAPRLAKRYLKEGLSGNPAVLVDSRRWILPIEQITPAQVQQLSDEERAKILQLAAQVLALPRPSVSATPSAPASLSASSDLATVSTPLPVSVAASSVEAMQQRVEAVVQRFNAPQSPTPPSTL